MSEQLVTCKNCGNQFVGKYCNRCGEKVYTPHDKSVPHFFEDALHFLTHFEGTFFNTLKAIFTKPGKLSLDYCDGLRKKYFKPLPFFMLLVVLYLIFPMFTGLNMPFAYYLNKGSYANHVTGKKTGVNIDSLQVSIDAIVNKKNLQLTNEWYGYRYRVADSIIKTNPSLAKLETAFNKKSEKTSKILLLVLLPLLAIVLWLFSIRKKRLFFDHLVLSTEINSLYLLISFFIMPPVIMFLYKVFPHIAIQYLSDFSIAAFSSTLLGIYTAAAFRRFYGDAGWWAILKAILMIIAHYFIVQLIYKFILFAVTFYLS